MRIVTDFERFEPEWEGGSSVYARTFAEFRRALRNADVAVVNCNVNLVLRLCAYFLVLPWRRKPVVAVDLVLRRPHTWSARLATRVKAFCWDAWITSFTISVTWTGIHAITASRRSAAPMSALSRICATVTSPGRIKRKESTYFASGDRSAITILLCRDGAAALSGGAPAA